ncbi:hypothetical protein A3J41_02275 [candidate division TM6 bacterium RIFCSPHIGHO2_12_FULL_38_8]|nr:MAG: hypothetical protein A3J41_02275 [candidate division TM6 bacterium RIFCSPHIGHO2_12_FULL_38_8]
MFPLTNFELIWIKRAVKSLQKIPQQYQTRILENIDKFQTNPDFVDLKKLTSFSDLYRIRVSDYRIILKVIKQDEKVFVIMIGHRKDIYDILQTLAKLQLS